jgi:hypothetical protein
MVFVVDAQQKTRLSKNGRVFLFEKSFLYLAVIYNASPFLDGK